MAFLEDTLPIDPYTAAMLVLMCGAIFCITIALMTADEYAQPLTDVSGSRRLGPSGAGSAGHTADRSLPGHSASQLPVSPCRRSWGCPPHT